MENLHFAIWAARLSESDTECDGAEESNIDVAREESAGEGGSSVYTEWDMMKYRYMHKTKG